MIVCYIVNGSITRTKEKKSLGKDERGAWFDHDLYLASSRLAKKLFRIRISVKVKVFF